MLPAAVYERPASVPKGMPSIAIVWLRRDLRVHDHPALAAAAREHDLVVPLFVLDPVLLGGRYRSARRTGYLRSCLHALDGALRERGGRLHVREGRPEQVVAELAAALDADAVRWTSDVSPYARLRDARVRAALGERARAHPGAYVVDVGRLRTQAGGPFTVFSPFHRAWLDAPRRPVERAPRALRVPPRLPAGRLPPGTHDGEAGEAAAARAARRFLAGPAARYAARHDRLAGGTSRLSPHLRFGAISPRALEQRALAHGAFRRQLAWRDFFAHLLLHDVGSRRPDPPWDDPGDALDAWREGRTGYPLVDAGMRQLTETGWMHNRARLVTGSFLTKDLHVDWRLGEEHFARELLDGDPAQNGGNWRWLASVGADPAPVSRRLFNPVRQQRRFDPDGAYVRRWVPELARVPDERLAEPWTMTEDEQRAAGCVIGRDYPAPIVDHAAERRRALERYRPARA